MWLAFCVSLMTFTCFPAYRDLRVTEFYVCVPKLNKNKNRNRNRNVLCGCHQTVAHSCLLTATHVLFFLFFFVFFFSFSDVAPTDLCMRIHKYINNCWQAHKNINEIVNLLNFVGLPTTTTTAAKTNAPTTTLVYANGQQLKFSPIVVSATIFMSTSHQLATCWICGL